MAGLKEIATIVDVVLVLLLIWWIVKGLK